MRQFRLEDMVSAALDMVGEDSILPLHVWGRKNSKLHLWPRCPAPIQQKADFPDKGVSEVPIRDVCKYCLAKAWVDAYNKYKPRVHVAMMANMHKG